MRVPHEEDTPCAPMAPLFDSVSEADHLIAKQVCGACPFIEWCEKELEYAESLAYRGFGPQGTWAGRLIRFRPSAKRPYNRSAPCGTESGYKRHRRNGEEACRACKQGVALARARRTPRKKAS